MNNILNTKELLARWAALENPGAIHTEEAFSNYARLSGKLRNVLHCAIPLTQAQILTDFELPAGVSASDCMDSTVIGKFPSALAGWDYNPKIRAVPQLPWMRTLPKEHASLLRSPWLQNKAPSYGLNINARNLRYQHQLWQQLKPKTLQGVVTTMVIGLPQMGYALTPHIQLDKTFMFFGSLARAMSPVQLFPAQFLFPNTNLGELANTPAPMYADILPATGGFAYPTMECEPDPWRVLAHYDRSDRYYGYPFSRLLNSVTDVELQNTENGVMLLPNGQRTKARSSSSYVYATLDSKLNEDLKKSREDFESSSCLYRGTVTHDGIPFLLPVEMQPAVYAVITTHWVMELDKPGDLSSYTLQTAHSAIRGYHLYQKVEPYYSNFMRLFQELGKDSNFKTYPLSSHLTDSWLGGNVRISNQQSRSELEHSPELVRAYYRQQLDWQMGVVNLMNHTSFRSKQGTGNIISKTGQELEQQIGIEGLAFHQMQRLLRFDSHLFPRPLKAADSWPDLHPDWKTFDEAANAGSLPKL